MSTHRAWRRQLLQHIGPVRKVNIPGLNTALLSHSIVGSICWEERRVIAQANIERQSWSRLPAILHKRAQHTPRPLFLKNVTALGVTGNIQQERGQTEASGVVRRICRLS